ncbi:MAG: galactose-1-phosphate uridylyltransferase, partial [Bacteroidota bacterium]
EEIEPFTLKDGLLTAQSERGICKVICFSPRHDLTLPQMDIAEIESVIDLWAKEYTDLGSIDFINHVQIFENKGETMGCSNPHPHGQIWAQESIPVEVMKKSTNQFRYHSENGRSMLGDYIQQEIDLKERILFENESMVILVPFWAIWPFEAMIAPKKPYSNILELESRDKKQFAEAIKWLTVRYDNLFNISFPYSSGIHQAPTDGKEHPEWHWHMSFYPPLLRSATVKKFMVGYEMFGNPQRDITPERSAEMLRDAAQIHYKTTD